MPFSLPLLSVRSGKKTKMGKNKQAYPPPAKEHTQRPKQRLLEPVLKLEKRTKSSSHIETHLAPAFQFQLLKDHHHEENYEEKEERHSLDSTSQSQPQPQPHSSSHHIHADPPSPPPSLPSVPHISNHSLPILEVWMDPDDAPPSPMQDDVYSVVRRRPSESASANKQVDRYQTQQWDAQRLVRVILGNKKKNHAASSSHLYDDEPLESNAILQAIRTYAGVKQQVQQLQQEKLEQAAALEASQQSQYNDRSGIVVAAKKIQSLERELSEARKIIQELERAPTTTTSKQEEATPETSPSSSRESSMSNMMFQTTPEDKSNNHAPKENTTSTTTAPEQTTSSVTSLEQLLEMQTKDQETLETCQEKLQQLFLQLATLRGRNNSAKSGKEKENNKPELSKQQAKKVRDQLQSFIHTIARQQSQQEIQDLRVQLIQQEQSHREQLLLQTALQQQQLTTSRADDSLESEESTTAFCTPSKHNEMSTSTSTSTIPPTQSNWEVVFHQLNSAPADQSQTNEDLVRLTQEMQASQMTVEALMSQLEQANQQLERQEDKHTTEWEKMIKEKEQVQVQQWSQLQQDLETAKKSLQSQTENAHTRESRLQQTITELESQIYESVAQFEVYSAADPMASQRTLDLGDQSFDDTTKELALSQTRIQELQTLLVKAREENEFCQAQSGIYREDKARDKWLPQELQLQLDRVAPSTDTSTLQENNQSTR